MKTKRAKGTDEQEPVYLTFRYCKDQCFRPDCKQCGYFWGPGSDKDGQPAHFGPDRKEKL